jgi:hypothetical protein
MIDNFSDGGAMTSDKHVEQIVTDMWGRMKNLECRYIDLANFYKKELLAQSGKTEHDSSSKSAVGGVV